MLALSWQPVPVSTPLRSLMLLYSVAPHDMPAVRSVWMISRIRHCDRALPALFQTILRQATLCQMTLFQTTLRQTTLRQSLDSGLSEVWATL